MGLPRIALSRYSGLLGRLEGDNRDGGTPPRLISPTRISPSSFPSISRCRPAASILRWPDDRSTRTVACRTTMVSRTIAFARATGHRVTWISRTHALRRHHGVFGKTIGNLRRLLRTRHHEEISPRKLVAAYKLGSPGPLDRIGVAALLGRAGRDFHRRGAPRESSRTGQAGGCFNGATTVRRASSATTYTTDIAS